MFDRPAKARQSGAPLVGHRAMGALRAAPPHRRVLFSMPKYFKKIVSFSYAVYRQGGAVAEVLHTYLEVLVPSAFRFALYQSLIQRRTSEKQVVCMETGTIAIPMHAHLRGLQ